MINAARRRFSRFSNTEKGTELRNILICILLLSRHETCSSYLINYSTIAIEVIKSSSSFTACIKEQWIPLFFFKYMLPSNGKIGQQVNPY